MKNKKLRIIIIVLLALVIIACGTVLVIKLWPQKKSDFDKYKNDVTSSETESVELPDNPINFAELKAQNPDVCGYIKVDNTAIDYPIMQSSDTPEDFYLNHDWLRKSKAAGSVYIQRINSNEFTDPVTVLYGHNMLNGTMFGTLKRFRNTQFFKDNRKIYVYRPGHVLTYEVCSAFVYDDRHILYSYNFNNEDDFRAFLNDCLNPKSLARNTISENLPSTKDKYIVLSTCTNVDTERYLVVGYLVDDTLTK